MIEDVHGINPMFKWLMEGHMNENAKMPGWLGGFKIQEISRIRLSCPIPTQGSERWSRRKVGGSPRGVPMATRLYYPRGRLGPTNDVSRAGGDFRNNFGGKLGVASRIQNEVESPGCHLAAIAGARLCQNPKGCQVWTSFFHWKFWFSIVFPVFWGQLQTGEALRNPNDLTIFIALGASQKRHLGSTIWAVRSHMWPIL